jgi:hypothetical protein
MIVFRRDLTVLHILTPPKPGHRRQTLNAYPSLTFKLRILSNTGLPGLLPVCKELLAENASGILHLSGDRMALLEVQDELWSIRRYVQALIGPRLSQSIHPHGGSNADLETRSDEVTFAGHLTRSNTVHLTRKNLCGSMMRSQRFFYILRMLNQHNLQER